MKVQLIIEGGGARGVYSAGVLDFFMDNNIKFLDVLGVSSGACNAISYKSWQPGRNIEIYTKYSRDKRYLSIRGLLRHGNIFGFNFIFDILPKELVYFDYNNFNKSLIKVEAAVTNIKTGKAEYHYINDLQEDLPYLRASCSIPFLSRVVNYKGKKMLDGGIANSIPIDYSLASGFHKQVVILTRDASYRKKKSRTIRVLRPRYPRYPRLLLALRNRHLTYNKSLDKIEELQREQKAFVIRPSAVVTFGRLEKDEHKLFSLYERGYNDAKEIYPDLLSFISPADNVIIG